MFIRVLYCLLILSTVAIIGASVAAYRQVRRHIRPSGQEAPAPAETEAGKARGKGGH